MGRPREPRSPRASARCRTCACPTSGADEWTRIVIVLGCGDARRRSRRCWRSRRGAGGALGFRSPRRSCSRRSTSSRDAARGPAPVPRRRRASHCCWRCFCGSSASSGAAHRPAAAVVVAAVLAALVAAPRARRRAAAAGLRAARAVAGRRAESRTTTGTTATGRWTGRATPARCCASRARDRAYWKAADLSSFDGLRWVQARAAAARRAPRRDVRRRPPRLGADAARDASAGCAPTQFVAAGTSSTSATRRACRCRPGPAVYATRDRPLRRGNAYTRDRLHAATERRASCARAAALALPAARAADVDPAARPCRASRACATRGERGHDRAVGPGRDALRRPSPRSRTRPTPAPTRSRRACARSRRRPYEFVLARRAAPQPGLQLLREPAAQRRAAGGLPVSRQARLLPAVLRRDGAAAAPGRRARARRRGLRARRL